jgi:hypothetical protein
MQRSLASLGRGDPPVEGGDREVRDAHRLRSRRSREDPLSLLRAERVEELRAGHLVHVEVDPVLEEAGRAPGRAILFFERCCGPATAKTRLVSCCQQSVDSL